MFTSSSQSWNPMWPEPVWALHVQPQFCKFIDVPAPLCLEDTVYLTAPITLTLTNFPPSLSYRPLDPT